MLKLVSILPLLFFLSGCSAIFSPIKMPQNGFYVVEEITTRGITKDVYHFVDDKRVRQQFKVKSTIEDLLTWYESPPENTMNYLSPSNNKISTYFSKNGLHGDGRIDLDSSNMVKNSVFYQVEKGKVVAQKSTLNSSKKYHYQIFNNEMKPVINGDFTEVQEVSQGYYLLKSTASSRIVNEKGNSVSADYAWIGTKMIKSEHFMAYDGKHFCVISNTGEIEIPCIYQDMMEFEGGKYAVSDGKDQKLIDWQGNVLLDPEEGDEFSYIQRTKNIFALKKKGLSAKIFWSNKIKKYLDIKAESHYSVAGSDEFWLVKTNKGLLLYDETGEIKVNFYLKSARVNNDYLIVKDTKNYSVIYKLNDFSHSKAFLGDISFSFSKEGGQNDVFYYKPIKGEGGLIAVNENMDVKLLIKSDFKKFTYVGNGFYALQKGYKNPVFLFSKKTGLINLPSKNITRYNDSIFNIRSNNSLYGLWDHTTGSWFKNPNKYTYITTGRNTEYAYYTTHDNGRRSGFLDKNGEELTPPKFEGNINIRFDKAVNMTDGKVNIFKLPEVKKILEVKGKFSNISEYGSIFVSTPIK